MMGVFTAGLQLGGGGGRGQGVKAPRCPEWGTGRREASYVVGPRAVGVCLS